MYMAATILVISYDTEVRNQSAAFHLTEEMIQQIKQNYPHLAIDYIDLLQDHFDFPLDQHQQNRFQSAAFLIVTFSNADFGMPLALSSLLNSLRTQRLLSEISVFLCQQKQNHQVLPLVEEALDKKVVNVMSKKDLAKQSFAIPC